MSSEDRRSFWNDPSGIHVPLWRDADSVLLWEAVEQSAAESGLEALGRVEAGYLAGEAAKNFRPRGGLRAFKVSVYTGEPGRAAVLIFPAFDWATDEQEADAVAVFARHLCEALEPPIARSYDPAGSNGCLEPHEITGALLWIDWWQYLGAPIVERVGRTKLESLEVSEVAALGNGAVVVRARRSPNEPFPRRPLADHLGIQLKPLRMWDPGTRTWSERDWPW